MICSTEMRGFRSSADSPERSQGLDGNLFLLGSHDPFQGSIPGDIQSFLGRDDSRQTSFDHFAGAFNISLRAKALVLDIKLRHNRCLRKIQLLRHNGRDLPVVHPDCMLPEQDQIRIKIAAYAGQHRADYDKNRPSPAKHR